MHTTQKLTEQPTLVARCCVCGKVRQGDVWREPEPGKLGGAEISHAYCPADFDSVMANIEVAKNRAS